MKFLCFSNLLCYNPQDHTNRYFFAAAAKYFFIIKGNVLPKTANPVSKTFSGQSAVLETLAQDALNSGVTRAAIVSANDIRVDPVLAGMCREPRCECYGLSKSCPPYVAGPAGFLKRLEKFSQALFIRIDVPSEILFSSDRREIFQLLHELCSGIEQRAIKMGFSNAQAYAGGSCKQIFCYDFPDCPVLSKNGTCRNPESARPSMSGFGINVARLIKTAGWDEDLITQKSQPAPSKMASVYGLVLIH